MQSEPDPNEANQNLDEYPWPKLGDKLMGSDKDWWNNACLNFTHDTWDLYAMGYLKAAERLAAMFIDTRESPDSVLYPICFLYRHYVELRLKITISEGTELVDGKFALPITHDLRELWKEARRIIALVYKGDPIDDLRAVDSIMMEFAEFDHNSIAFRYPVDKKGNPTLKDLKLLNIRQFAQVMKRISNFLDSVSGGVSQYLSDVRQFRAENRE